MGLAQGDSPPGTTRRSLSAFLLPSPRWPGLGEAAQPSLLPCTAVWSRQLLPVLC